MSSKTISILGSGWLGLPLAEHLINKDHYIKASTTSEHRLSELSALDIAPYILDIKCLTDNVQRFLQSKILIINIPSKNTYHFELLLKEIKKSGIEKVLFVSSTSVYENSNQVISESDGLESPLSDLRIIEELFSNCCEFKTTIVRFGGLVGYTRNPNRFFSGGKTLYNPDSNVNMIHRDDCIEIINQIIDHEAWGEVFNCCTDSHPTKREFYTHISKYRGVPAPLFGENDTPSFKIISNKKVKKILQYEFIHTDLMKIKF